MTPHPAGQGCRGCFQPTLARWLTLAGFYMRHLSSTGWRWEDDAMTLWLAWIDPISARVSHWSAGPFQNTPEGIADADRCIAAYKVSEYPGLCRVLYWRGDYGQAIKPLQY